MTKFEAKRMEKVNKIIQLCLEINGIEKRQREITGNKPAVFFQFSAHTAGLYISVFETGWGKEKSEDKEFDIYLDNSFEELEDFEELESEEREELYKEVKEALDKKTEEDLDSCIQYLMSIKSKNEPLQKAV